MIKNLLKFKLSVRMGRSVYERGIAVGARLAGLGISDLLI